MITQAMGQARVWDLARYYELGLKDELLPEGATWPQSAAYYLGVRDRKAEIEHQAAVNRNVI